MKLVPHTPLSTRSRRLPAPLALWLLCCGLCLSVPALARQSAVAAPGWRLLSQGRPAFAVPTLRVGRLNPNAQESVTVAFKLPDPGALDAFLADVQNPASPNFRRFLTPAQFAQRFGPAPADYDALVQYLKTSGLSIASLSPQRLWVNAVGSVSRIETAFQTHLANFSDGHVAFFANETAPSLPANLQPLIEHVFGLDNYAREHPAYHAAKRSSGYGYIPIEFDTSYDLTSLYNAGYRGKGKTIGIFSLYLLDGTTAGSTTDVTNFIQAYVRFLPGSPPGYAANITYKNVSGAPAPTQSSVEANLDVEMCVSTAPDANIIVYQAENGYAYQVLAQIVADNLADVATESYASDELYLKTNDLSYLQSYHTLQATAASQGITYYAAAGDWGCTQDNPGSGKYELAVAYPASDPTVVGVGGTSLTPQANYTYGSEVVWNNSTGATGGGYSVYFTASSWQEGLGVSNPNNMRLVPDIAAVADPDTGILVYYGGGEGEVGGTSASSPLWAGATAVMEQYIDAQDSSEGRLGNISSLLYPLESNAAFHDVTSGNNTDKGITGYSARVGYDLCTGIGSADFYELAQAIAGALPLVATVSGNVSLEGYNTNAYPLTFAFRVNGVTSFTQTVTPAADGSFTLMNLPAANYTIAVKGDKWLQRVVSADASAGNVPSLSITLIPGDLNGDNVVDINDFGILADEYGLAGIDMPADLNGDGVVDINDFGMMAASFGLAGDN